MSQIHFRDKLILNIATHEGNTERYVSPESPCRDQTCLLHFFPDWQKTPRSRTHTLIQPDIPDLSRAARLVHRAARQARLRRPHKVKQVMPSQPSTAFSYIHLKSWHVVLLQEDSQSIWEDLHKTGAMQQSVFSVGKKFLDCILTER